MGRSQTILACLCLAVLPVASVVAAPKQYVWQTNSQGNDTHIYSIPDHKLVKRLEVGAQPHGIAAAADASIVYMSIEAYAEPQGELIWVNPRTYEIEHRMTIGPKPHQLACTPDGRWVYVPCNDENYWVIDGKEKRLVKIIHTGGRPHNTTISPDGRWMYLSPIGNPPSRVTIVDVKNGHEVVDHIPFSDSCRPPALSLDNTRFYQNVDNLIGFEVADIASRKVIKRIEHTIRPEFKGVKSRCHGLAIRPDQKEIWSCNVEHKMVHIHDATKPDYPEIGMVPMPGRIYWLSFTPDSKYAYVAVRSTRQMAVVDTQTKKVIAHLPVGNVPKRNLVITIDDATAAVR